MPKEYAAFVQKVKELSNFYHLENPSFNMPENIKSLAKQYGYTLPVQAIIGEAELVDIVRNSKEVFAIPGNYH